MIGKSFYEQVLPPNSVNLGWSSYAAVWLSRPPAVIPDSIFPACATGAARVAFEQQAAGSPREKPKAGPAALVLLVGVHDRTRARHYPVHTLLKRRETGAARSRKIAQQFAGGSTASSTISAWRAACCVIHQTAAPLQPLAFSHW